MRAGGLLGPHTAIVASEATRALGVTAAAALAGLLLRALRWVPVSVSLAYGASVVLAAVRRSHVS